MPTRINGLEAFSLTRAAFARLRSRRAVATLWLRTYDVTPDVVRRPPKERLGYLRARLVKWLGWLRSGFPHVHFQLNQPEPIAGVRGRWSALPTQVVVRVTPRELEALARAGGIGSVHVTAIQGMRRRRMATPSLTWHCVRARVAVTVEGQVRGMQTVEDRFVAVRASSFEDAISRLKPHWRAYATPYLNSAGQTVRWKLDRVLDVYTTCDESLDPAGAEVYSKLSQRRLRVAHHK